MLAVGVLASAAGAQTAVKLPPELELVPADGFLFVSARVGELWNSDQARILRLVIPGKELKPLDDFEKALGLTLSDFERVCLFLPSEDLHKHGPILLATARKPYDRDRVVNTLTGGVPADKLKAGIFYRLPESSPLGALHLFNERTVILGRVDDVGPLLDQSKKKSPDGPLAPALQLAAGPHHVVIGLNGASLRQNVPANMPLEAQRLIPLMALSHAAITVHVKDGAQAMFRLTFQGENQARAGEGAVKDVLGFMQDGLKYLAGELPKETRENPQIKEAFQRLDAWLEAMPVKVEGSTVVVTPRLKSDEIALFAVLLMPTVQKVRELVARSPR